SPGPQGGCEKGAVDTPGLGDTGVDDLRLAGLDGEVEYLAAVTVRLRVEQRRDEQGCFELDLADVGFRFVEPPGGEKEAGASTDAADAERARGDDRPSCAGSATG